MAEPLISSDQIYREVQKAIADALQISEQKVEPDSSLIRDLAAESLDFIDINFRLEQRFSVGMPRKYFLEHVEELFGEGTAIDQSGHLTEAAVTIWNARLGSAGPRVHAGMPLDDVPALVTPRTLVMIVEEILATCPAACPACGKAAWAVADGGPITCGGCGAPAPLLTGDDVIRRWLDDFRARGGLVSRAS
jgi:acyl carrier protein